MTNQVLKAALRRATCLSAIAAIAAPGIALAQDAPPADTVASEESGEAIVVTGSRIARPELAAPTPLNVVTAESIERTGQTNISEVLRRQPIFSTGVSGGNSNFNTDGNGLNLLDLRGLGTSRTLVLINGKRVVAGTGGSSAVDINMVPTDLVQRVETITGGASAIYGSDAMAGVVNFVLRERFTGVELRGQGGISSHGDSGRYRVSATVGTDFAGGAGNVWVNGVYDVDNGLLSANRSFAANDVFGRSSFAPQGAFGLNGTIFDVTGFDENGGGNLYANDYTFDSAGNLKQGFVQNEDGFNRNAFRRLTVPVKRYLASAGLNYEFSDAARVYVLGQFGRTESSATLEPYPMAGGDPDADGAGSIDIVGGLRIDNPYIPGAIAAAIAARNSDADPDNDVGLIAFRRRLSDVFDRSNRNRRDFYRISAGVRGEILSGWDYDVSYTYGQTKDRTASETVATDRITNALDAVLLGGQIVCRSAAARAEGCVPLNIFGANTADPAAVDYVRRGGLESVLNRKIEQHVASATLSGTLFRLPGGDVRAAFGAEYRKESSSDDWDADTNAGNTLGNVLTDTRGSYDVKDVFAELEVPLMADRPFFHYLGLRGAVRYDDYSTVGGVVSWLAGADWAPSRDIRFRGMYSQASRAPNIGELFSSQSETFPGTLTLDPCNGVTASSTGQYDSACRAIPGIASQIAANGVFEYSTVQIQSINGFDGGNPNLREETAKTWTAGAVITPRFIPGLTLTADWYRIQVANAINSAPREDTVKECLLDTASPSCALVQRLGTGYITRIDAININTGGFLTSGIDVSLNYQTEIEGFARIGLGANWNHLLQHKRKPSNASAYIDEKGQLQDANGERLGSGFEDRVTFTTTLTRGAFSLSWTGRYFSAIKDTLDPANAPDPETNNVPSKFYNDFQARFEVGEDRKLEFYLGVDNAFDVGPPLLPNGATASGLIGGETAQEYDTLGRFFYAGVRAKF